MKTKKELREQLKLMDVVIEVRDARIPLSTTHPKMDAWLGNRKWKFVLNREDMISNDDRNDWARYFAKQGIEVIFTNSKLGMGAMKLGRLAKSLAGDVNGKRREKGLLPRSAIIKGLKSYTEQVARELATQFLSRSIPFIFISWIVRHLAEKDYAIFYMSREKSYLNCSPLQIPRSSRIVPPRPPFSPIGRVTSNNKNMEQPCPSVDTDSIGKENSKVELPKLSVERQQMKKKKKNAGFNLRKSLAWDRAFSTEEGVLDSSELSKITGTACLIGGDLLPPIQEEYRESISFE